jgi:DNA-binding transcriptional regulator YdaS (Cro superfamily)
MSNRKKPLHDDPRVIACELAKATAGGYIPLAAKLGVSRQVVYGWTRVPPKWVLPVERETGISRHQLRPDVFGPAPEKAEVAG